MADDRAHGARTDDSRRPQTTAPWRTSTPGDGQIQSRTPAVTTGRVGRRPRVTAS